MKINPEYTNRSIVNLMSSVLQALGPNSNFHTPLQTLNPDYIRKYNNVVLLVIDGLGYNYLVNQAGNSHLHHHLHGKLTTVFPSTTATAITTFLTGLAPQQHGLTGWFTYFQEIQQILSVLPVKTRFTMSQGNQTTIDIQSLYGHTPVFDRLDVNSYIVTPQNIAFSEYSLAHRGKASINPYGSLNDCFSKTRDIILGSKETKYIYTYWPMFDGMAHEKGVNSPEVAQHFQDIDSAFNTLLDSIKGSNTLLLATADHGMVDSGPEHCIELRHHRELQDMLAMPLSGERRLCYCYIKPTQHEKFRHYIESNLTEYMEIHDSDSLLQQNIYGLGPEHPQLQQRIGDFILEMKNNYTIMDTLEGENHFYHIGTHGARSEDEMLVPLIIVET